MSYDNLVIISEYSAPDDFICIWEKQINSTYNKIKKDNVEKLFIYKFYH